MEVKTGRILLRQALYVRKGQRGGSSRNIPEGDAIMKKKVLVWLLTLALCLGAAIPALAANVFVFKVKEIRVFEGETVKTSLRREGNYAGEGKITYKSAKESIATVSSDGKITGVKKGQTEVTAILYKDGKRVIQARITVKVIRPVTKVTLKTSKMSVFEPDDPEIASLLKEETKNQVIVIPSGKVLTLSATCTPDTANNLKVAYKSTDEGVLKITGTSMKAVQPGECDLVVSSVQNPKVKETFRVLVIQPIKKIQISAGNKKVDIGSKLRLKAVCTPDSATMKKVTWKSSKPGIAKVNSDGTVTGVKKGTVIITATAADGSGVSAIVYISVTQPVTSIDFTQETIPVVVGRTVQAKTKVLPADASDKGLKWSSSNEKIATVKAGQITGHKAGTCTITCTSRSNPEVSASVEVTVSQLVTKIVNTNAKEELSLRVGESLPLTWDVQPEDATNKDLTFRSAYPRLASVDENGVVTALGRGRAVIYATATDSSKKRGSVTLNIVQPVTGVHMAQEMYYVQRGGGTTVRAVTEPRNANNQQIYWSSGDEAVASIRSNGTSTGYVYGASSGETTIYAYTEDGGFVAEAKVKVGNFNDAVTITGLDVDLDNQIRITLRNASSDLIIGNVRYKVECFDKDLNPLICNTDGVSTFFEGEYTYLLEPDERSMRPGFCFRDYAEPEQELGGIIVTITGWYDAYGYNWTIPEEDQIPRQWAKMKR